jgi:hypothetical protein
MGTDLEKQVCARYPKLEQLIAENYNPLADFGAFVVYARGEKKTSDLGALRP